MEYTLSLTYTDGLEFSIIDFKAKDDKSAKKTAKQYIDGYIAQGNEISRSYVLLNLATKRQVI